jgi:hypothetical protein
MSKSKNPFTIIQNDRTNFSQFSIRQVLEIGALCKTDLEASSFAQKQVAGFKRDDTIKNVIEKLKKEEGKFIILEDEFSFVNHDIVLEKLKELNNTKSENLLNLSASTLKTITPTLISDKLTISEICKIMLNVKYPCVMTSNRIITPYDILDIICKEG